MIKRGKKREISGTKVKIIKTTNPITINGTQATINLPIGISRILEATNRFNPNGGVNIPKDKLKTEITPR